MSGDRHRPRQAMIRRMSLAPATRLPNMIPSVSTLMSSHFSQKRLSGRHHDALSSSARAARSRWSPRCNSLTLERIFSIAASSVSGGQLPGREREGERHAVELARHPPGLGGDVLFADLPPDRFGDLVPIHAARHDQSGHFPLRIGVGQAGHLVRGRFGQPAVIHQRLDVLGQGEQGFGAGDAAAADAQLRRQRLRIAFLQRLEPGHRPRQVERPEIVAAMVLDDLIGEQVGFAQRALDRQAGHGFQPGQLRRPPAAFAGDDAQAFAFLVPHHPQRLQDAAGGDARGQAVEFGLDPHPPRLVGIDHQLLDRHLDDLTAHALVAHGLRPPA